MNPYGKPNNKEILPHQHSTTAQKGNKLIKGTPLSPRHPVIYTNNHVKQCTWNHTEKKINQVFVSDTLTPENGLENFRIKRAGTNSLRLS